MSDLADLYSANVAALTALAGDLTEEERRTPVPASPGWDVHGVLSHLAGLATETVSGRLQGPPTAEQNATQVRERADAPPAEVVAEIGAHSPAVVDLVRDGSPGLAWDIAVHHADIHEALGKHRLAPALWEPVLAAQADRLPEQADDVDAYERFRMLFSRRSRAQMRDAFPGVADDVLDGIGVFGPRDDDQPIPVA
jgi:uncharacterized protein (TIGR03083 family)